MMHYRIGQTIPATPTRGVQEGEMDAPRWFALVARPQREQSARAWLERQGVTAWYPAETAYRRVPRGKAKRQPYERRVAPGYVFARFTGWPQWDRLFYTPPASHYVRGAVGVDGRPLAITDEALAQMAMIPDELERLRRQQEEARRIRPGDKVEVLDGPMQGWVVDVASLRGGMAMLMLPLLGKDASAIEVTRLRKLGVET